MENRTLVESRLRALAHLLVASAVGLIVLPLLFSSAVDLGGARPWLWLVGSVAVSLWLLHPAPVLARACAQGLDRLPLHSQECGPRRTPTLEVSRRLLTIAYVVLVQAIVRRPLVAALAPTSQSIGVEGAIAILAFLVLLVVMALLHQVGKPLVEDLARFGLDTFVATSGSEALLATHEAHSQPAAATMLAPAEKGGAETVAAPTQTAVSRPREQRRSVA